MGSVSKGMGIGIGLVIGLIIMAIAVPLACTTMCATGVVGTAALVAESERAKQEEEARPAASIETKDKTKAETVEAHQKGSGRQEQVVSSIPKTLAETVRQGETEPTTRPANEDGEEKGKSLWERQREADRQVAEIAAEKAYNDAVKMENMKSWQAAITGHQRNATRRPATEFGRKSARAVTRLKKAHPELKIPKSEAP